MSCRNFRLYLHRGRHTVPCLVCLDSRLGLSSSSSSEVGFPSEVAIRMTIPRGALLLPMEKGCAKLLLLASHCREERYSGDIAGGRKRTRCLSCYILQASSTLFCSDAPVCIRGLRAETSGWCGSSCRAAFTPASAATSRTHRCILLRGPRSTVNATADS